MQRAFDNTSPEETGEFVDPKPSSPKKPSKSEELETLLKNDPAPENKVLYYGGLLQNDLPKKPSLSCCAHS
jgi:hypothetical protein